MGLNTWAGVGAPPQPPDAIGLRYFTLKLPKSDEVGEIVDRFFNGTASHLDGIGLKEIAESVLAWHQLAYPNEAALDSPGFYKFKREGELHAYNPAAVIKREIAAGAAFDIAIVTRTVLDELIAQGSVIRETCKDLARCGLGLAVRASAPKPDISTVETFKRALLAAKSIVRSRDGTSGQYFETLLDRLNIGDKVRPKIVIGPAGRIAELVANGEAEIAVQQVSELMPVKGADFVGSFPAELQLYTDFAAGVATRSNVRDAAQAFVDLLAAPSSAPLFQAKGLEPIAS